MQSLLDRWSQAVLGHGQVVLLVGESGVGKTSLTSALARQVSASGALVVTTGCFEAERSLFLQPFVEALRSVIAWQTPQAARELFRGWNGPLSELVPEVARLIGPVNYERYERGTPETEHRRTLEALAAVLGRLTESHPVLLIIEELQHAGQSTIEALHFLTTRVTGCRLLILGTLEAAEAAHITDSLEGSVTRIGIGPLSRAAVRTLAMEAGLPVDADWLYEWTGGSPYYVTELLRPGHELSAAGHSPPEHMSTSLRDAVARRISHAGRDVGLLLQLGAILGVAFSLDDVAALGDLGVEECIRRAEKAQRAGLLEPSGETFRFSGHIIRKVAYDSASEPVRISRHRRAARLFAAQPEAAAHQLVAAGDWAPAVEAWLRAADAAHLAFSNLEAERLLTEALASATRSGDRRLLASVRLRRGQVRADLGRYDAAREDLSTTIGLATELGDEGWKPAPSSNSAGPPCMPATPSPPSTWRPAPATSRSRPRPLPERCPVRCSCSAGSVTGTATTQGLPKPTSRCCRPRPTRRPTPWPSPRKGPCSNTSTTSVMPVGSWSVRWSSARTPDCCARCCRACSSPRSHAVTRVTSREDCVPSSGRAV
ncbi:ATP-binding protein [Streptomyces chiangmaiensis]